jgi:SAM-dependent methyltransferase
LQTPKSIKKLYQALRYGGYSKQKKYDRRAKTRLAKFERSRWQKAGDMAVRNYESYEEYLEHQAEKLDRILQRRQDKDVAQFDEFVRRFKLCAEIEGLHTAICLGARLGTEVKALHSLGFFAVGIDLNPGPDNAWVTYGDFHNLVFPDGSVDMVYCNALDHVFDLERVLGEVVRVLQPQGVFVADVLPGFDEGFIPGEYEATHWRTIDSLVARIEAAGGLKKLNLRDLGQQRRNRWAQIVFKRSS